jgi:hypothetical protein
MSKASRKARREAEAQAEQPTVPAAALETEAPDDLLEQSDEPEAPSESTAELYGGHVELTEPLVLAAPEPDPPLPATPHTFTPDGIRYADLPMPLGVRCVALVNVLWNGMTAGPGTELTLPEANVERLVSKGIVRRI